MLFPILREQLLFLRSAGFEIHTASIDGPLGRRIQEDGFPWTAVPFSREVAPLADWRALRFVENFCREQRFSIVHTHTPKANVIGQWAARRAGVPIVVQTLHGFYFHDRMNWLKRRVWVAVERFSAKHSSHILCQNPEDVETALRLRIARPEQISLLGNGVDLQRFSPADDLRRREARAKLNIQQDALVVGMVGRLVSEKGFPEFVAAGERLAGRFPKLHLLAVGHQLVSERAGEGWTPPASGPLKQRMTVLVNRDDMPDLYAAMDLNVLPSHREGFPRVLIEGAACGLAQVATYIRGCRQTIDDGKTGLLVEVGDVSGLAAAIERLLNDGGLRTEMGRAAREKALAEFDQTKVFEKVAAHYRQLLSMLVH
ncbi:MAG TPA: glycosyltransferase family 4 protein [Planctomycetota bacterium]